MDLSSLLDSLLQQAQPRLDITPGSAVPRATFAGRIVQPGDTLASALSRMPMGSGEGDLPSAVKATAMALAQPAMQTGSGLLAKSLIPKLAMGVFRDIGLRRTTGETNPVQYLMELQTQPNYERFKQLAQNLVRRGLGDEFPVYRGKQQTDPLMQSLLMNAEQLPPATAVSLDPNIGRGFAISSAEATRKPAYLMKGRATPESVVGLLPRRFTHGHEAELVIDPNLMTQRQLAAKAVDMGGGSIQFVKPNLGGPINDIMGALLDEIPVRKPWPVETGGLPKQPKLPTSDEPTQYINDIMAALKDAEMPTQKMQPIPYKFPAHAKDFDLSVARTHGGKIPSNLQTALSTMTPEQKALALQQFNKGDSLINAFKKAGISIPGYD